MVIKPRTDERSYESITLANQLQAMIVSDPDAEKAAAALDCHVGHFSDPECVPGLAHFCEHMLFLGTEDYPREGEYKEFLSHHGGRSNAATSQEHTNYKFEVAADHLAAALDRFAAFFRCPLFTESATQREMHAVDSENKKKLQEDGRRFYQLLKHTSDPRLPFAKFGSGNLQTLCHTPAAEGVDVREQLLHFHREHYCAGLMTVCVIGREPLPTLRRWVTEKFGAIPFKGLARPQWEGHPFSGPPMQVTLKPVKEIRAIHLLFPVPHGPCEHWRAKPASYWSHLLGHEGEGSVLALAKALGYATSLEAGVSYSATAWSLFGVKLRLTVAGMRHVTELVEMVFAYLKVVKAQPPLEWIHVEQQRLAQVQFDYQPQRRGLGYASAVARQLQQYPAEHALSGPCIALDWAPGLIAEYGACLCPANLRLYVSSSDAEVCGLPDTEPWYGTQFRREPLSAQQREAWEQPREWPELRIHDPNPFMPGDLELLPAPPDAQEWPVEVPAPAAWQGVCRLWFQHDTVHGEPRVVYHAYFVSPALQGVRNTVLATLYEDMVEDALAKALYPVSIAGYCYSFERVPRGMLLTLIGFSDRTEQVLTAVMDGVLQDFSGSGARFAVMKERLCRVLANTRKDPPDAHALRATNNILTAEYHTAEDKLTAAQGLELDDLLQWIPEFFSSVHVQALVQGNATMAAASQLLGNCVVPRLLARLRSPPGAVPRNQRLQLPPATECVYRFDEPDPDNKNSAVVLYFQIGVEDLRRDVTVALLAQLLRPLFFQKLRTEEQLGYSVHSGPHNAHYVSGFAFRVQSPVAAPEALRDRVAAFLGTAQAHLRALPEDAFAEARAALVQKWQEPDKRLVDASHRHWAEICSEQYLWGRRSRRVELLKAVTLPDVLALYDRHFVDPAHRSLLTVLCCSAACSRDAGHGGAGAPVPSAEPRATEHHPAPVPDAVAGDRSPTAPGRVLHSDTSQSPRPPGTPSDCDSSTTMSPDDPARATAAAACPSSHVRVQTLSCIQEFKRTLTPFPSWVSAVGDEQ